MTTYMFSVLTQRCIDFSEYSLVQSQKKNLDDDSGYFNCNDIIKLQRQVQRDIAAVAQC